VAFRDPVNRHHTRVGWALVSITVGGLSSVVLAGLAQGITLLFNLRNHQLDARQTDIGPLSGLAARTAALRQLRD